MDPLTDPCSDIGKRPYTCATSSLMIGPGFDPEASDYTDPTGHYNDKDDRMDTAQRARSIFVNGLRFLPSSMRSSQNMAEWIF